jgi:RNA polymerase sigma factor (sigma-70 family)
MTNVTGAPQQDYQGRNNTLFYSRADVMARIETLRNIAEPTRDEVEELRRAEWQLDSVNTDIVKENMGLVRSYVRRFTSKTSRQDSEDYEGAAVVGLMKAISTYDPAKGKFSTWAYKAIQRECLKAVRDAEYNMTLGDFEKRPDILRAVADLQSDDASYNPSFEEVAAVAGTTVEQVSRVLAAPNLISLQRPVSEEGDTYLSDMIADDSISVEDEVIRRQRAGDLERYGLAILDEREMYVIARRFGLDGEPEQKLNEIGKAMGLSREGVRQIEAKALSKLNHPIVLRKLVRQGRR